MDHIKVMKDCEAFQKWYRNVCNLVSWEIKAIFNDFLSELSEILVGVVGK